MSTELHEKVQRIALQKEISFFDALLHLIETDGLDPDEIIEMLDASAKEKLKHDAIKEHRLRPSFVAQQDRSIAEFFI